MSDSDDLDIRLSVTETKVTNMQDDFSEHRSMLRDISLKVDSVKERFDKMNGAIPHIQEACSNIEAHLKEVTESNNLQANQITRNSSYVKLLWGLVVPIALTIIGATIKLIFFG